MDMENQVEIKQEVKELDTVLIKSEKADSNYGVQCDRIKAEPIADENQANFGTESVDQEDQLAVVIKCETLPEKSGIKCDDVENMEVSGFDAESNIKIEYDPDLKSDAPTDEMKAEEIVENWNDVYLNLDESSQIKVEDLSVLEDEKLEGKLASELNEELDMKPENDSSTQSDSVFNMNKKLLQAVNVGAEGQLLICYNCNQRFSSKISLINHTCAGKISLKIGSGRRKLVQRRQRPSYEFVSTHCNVGFTRKETFHDKHKEFIASVSSKILECIHCNYKTTRKNKLAKHMLKHASLKFRICEYCNAPYKRKESLDDHIFRNHPDVKTLIKRKMHECPQCDYKTTKKFTLTMHMLTHPGTKSELPTCPYCNESLKGKTSLDNHIIKKHPDFITAIKRKIRECGECNYKTTRKNVMDRHALTHSHAVLKMYVCEHCDATFKRKDTLDNHIFKNHPEFIASIKKEILECRQCDYKTIVRNKLTKHMMMSHSNKTATLSVCQDCNASFKYEISLHDHILKNHPDLKASIVRKMHECTQCDYKTVIKHHLTKHMSKHDGIAFAPSVCQHCNAAFKSNETLDSHILRNHPDFVESIRGKIHECTQCGYRTVRKNTLTRHMLTHPGMATELIICEHCKMKFKSAVGLDNHILKKHPNFEPSIESKIHQCELCPYRSTLKNNMNRHIRLTHSSTAAELFTCKHCNYLFETEENLETHILKSHPAVLFS